LPAGDLGEEEEAGDLVVGFEMIPLVEHGLSEPTERVRAPAEHHGDAAAFESVELEGRI